MLVNPSPSPPPPAATPVSTESLRSSADSLPMLFDPSGVRAEAIRAMRTHIMAQHINLGRRALAICAASAEVGCSFVAVNLAVALSQAGLKTLLIDADLRQGSGVEAFIPDPQPENDGLQQMLSDPEAELGTCIRQDVLPSLSILYSGGAVSDAQELISDHRFGEVISECLREFDITIVDTPPANSYADARRISTVVGYSLVVARKDKSFIGDVKTLINELVVDHARVVGTVLNEA